MGRSNKDQAAIAKLYMESDTPDVIQLIDKNGTLYTSFNDIVDKFQRDYYASETDYSDHKEVGDHRDVMLMTTNSYGEPSTVNWPKYDENTLRLALFDARETGVIPHVSHAILPNGEEFEIDGEMHDDSESPEGYWY